MVEKRQINFGDQLNDNKTNGFSSFSSWKTFGFPCRLVIEDACILDESIIFGEGRAGACIVC